MQTWWPHEHDRTFAPVIARVLIGAWVVAFGACSPSPAPPPAAPATPATSTAPPQATQAQPQQAAQPAPAPLLRAAIDTVSAGADGLAFALVAGPCTDNRCPAIIELRSAARVLDSATLDFAASGAAYTREPDSVPAAWTAGSEEGAVTTTLQPLRLTSTPGAGAALLVQQAAGFEHVKRRHDLFAHDGAKLRKLWSAAEGAGPAWSMAAVVPGPGGARDEIVFIQGFQPGSREADTLSAQRLAWDDTSGSLVQRVQPQLPALVAREFASIAAARKAVAADPCLAGYWVLPAERFGGKPKRFTLAAVGVDAGSIQRSLDPACASRVKHRTAAMKPDPKAAKE